MYQVSVVCPPELTGDLAGELTGNPGVLNLVVLPGVARRPEGDSVQFGLLTGAANPVLRRLRDTRRGDGEPVTIQVVDNAIGDSELESARRGWHQREISPVWEVSEGRIRGEATYAVSFFLLLVIAGVSASAGILTNSQILIVAAADVGVSVAYQSWSEAGGSARVAPAQREPAHYHGRGGAACPAPAVAPPGARLEKGENR